MKESLTRKLTRRWVNWVGHVEIMIIYNKGMVDEGKAGP